MKQHLPKTSMTLVRLIVILVFILEQAACSKATQPVLSPVPGEEAVTLTFAGDEYVQSLYEPLIDEFHQQNPTITVQFVAQPTSGYTTTADYYQSQSSAADTSVVVGSGGEMTSYFLDLQSQIDSDPSFKPDDFWPDALTGCQDGEAHTLGIPVVLFLTGIYYDEQAFAADGLKAPQPGWTWDDFRRDATTLAKQTGTGVRYGYADPPSSSLYSILTPLLNASLASSGGEIDPHALAANAQWYLDMAKAKSLYPITGMDGNPQAQDQWTALFKTDETRPAMWAGNLAQTVPGTAAGNSFAISDYDFAPFPVASDGSASKTTPLMANCAVVSKASTHPVAAWAWVSFLSHHWINKDKTQLTELVQMPARQSVAEAGGFWTNLPEKAQAAVRYGLKHGCYLNLYLPIEQTIDTILEKAAAGQSDFTTALVEAKTGLAASAQQTASSTSFAVATPLSTQDNSTDVIEVKFYDMYDPFENPTVDQLVMQFNKTHPDIVVKIYHDIPIEGRVNPQEGGWATEARSFDCWIGYNGPLSAESGQILSLDAFMETEYPSFQQDFDPALLDAFRYQGDLYDLPLVTQPVMISYNADLLAKRGLKPPSIDWTFDDFLNLIQSAASTSEADPSYGYMWGGGGFDIFTMLVTGRKVQWVDLAGNYQYVKLDTPEMANAMEWLAGLVNSGAVYYKTPQSFDVDKFFSGQVAFWDSKAGQKNRLGDAFINSGKSPSFKVGIVPLPVMTAGSLSFQWNEDRGLYISRQSKNPQACWTWMKFLSDQSAVLQGVPARNSVAASPEWEAIVGVDIAPIYRAASARMIRDANDPSAMNAGKFAYPLRVWQGEALIAVFQGNDPVLTLAEAQRKADAYLACMQGVDPSALSQTEIQDKVKACAIQVDPQGQW